MLALASAAAIAAADHRVQQVCIWTPDKDLAQCVRTGRVVQIDRRTKVVRDADGVHAKFGVSPELIPDYLALVGDSADGYPGIAGIGPKGAASLIGRYGKIDQFPPEALKGQMEMALLFKKLATLRTDAPVMANVDELRWLGSTGSFAECCARMSATTLPARAQKAFAAMGK